MAKTDKLKAARRRHRRRIERVFTANDTDLSVNQRASLRLAGDEVLKLKCMAVEPEAITDPKSGISCIIKNMRNVLGRSRTGVGLAANQAGYDVRIILVHAYGAVVEMINPVVVDHSEDKVTATEGCLSYPGIFKEVPRYKWLEVEWLNDYGKKQKDIFGQETSRIIQHELDHLEGYCQIDEFNLASIGVPAWLR